MKRAIASLLIPVFFLLAGCGTAEAQEQFFTMDTVMSITVYGKGAGGSGFRRPAGGGSAQCQALPH